MLGVGDFYYELGVQIIEVCLALKHRNGGKACLEHHQSHSKILHFQMCRSLVFHLCVLGLITLDELHHRVLKGRGKFAQDVSQ